MILTLRSPVTQELNTMELDITQEQLNRWQGGELIQDVFPHLKPEQREFIKTGVYPGEWEAIFAKYKEGW